MRIVLDTTETFAHLRLQGPTFDKLLTFIDRGGATLFMPECIRLETRNHYRQQLQAHHRSASDASRKLQDLGDFQTVIQLFDVTTQMDTYDGLVKLRLERFGADVIKPPVDVHKLVERCLDGRKPFQVRSKDSDKEKGFRDSVLWESVLWLASQADDEVVLITQNTGDFAGEDGELHQDFVADLPPEAAPVRLVLGLKKFIESAVDPGLQSLDNAAERLAKLGGLNQILSAWEAHVLDQVREHVERAGLAIEAGVTVAKLIDLDFEGRELCTIKARYLNDDAIAFSVTIVCFGEVHFEKWEGARRVKEVEVWDEPFKVEIDLEIAVHLPTEEALDVEVTATRFR